MSESKHISSGGQDLAAARARHFWEARLDVNATPHLIDGMDLGGDHVEADEDL